MSGQDTARLDWITEHEAQIWQERSGKWTLFTRQPGFVIPLTADSPREVIDAARGVQPAAKSLPLCGDPICTATNCQPAVKEEGAPAAEQRALKLSDLNQTLVERNPERAKGMLDFANLINAMYPTARHTHLIGDCGLAKLNMLRRSKQPRDAAPSPAQEKPVEASLEQWTAGHDGCGKWAVYIGNEKLKGWSGQGKCFVDGLHEMQARKLVTQHELDIAKLRATLATASSPSEEKISPAAEARDSTGCGSRAETGDVWRVEHDAERSRLYLGNAWWGLPSGLRDVLDEIVIRHNRSLSPDATNSARVSVSSPKSSEPSVTPEEKQ